MSTYKNNKIYFLSLTVVALLAIVHFLIIAITSVDIPWFDEYWLVYYADKPVLESAWAAHNNHRLFFSKLIILVSYKIGIMNYAYFPLFSYIFYCFVIYFYYRLIKRGVSALPYLPLLFLPFFTKLLFWNFVQDQTGVHFNILFALLALYFGFIKATNIKNIILMILFLIASIISFSYVYAFGIMAVYIIKEVVNIQFSSLQRRYDFCRLFIVGIIFLVIAMVSFYGGDGGEMTYPHTFRFWDFFIRSIPQITVFISTNFVVSLLITVFVAVPPILMVFDKNIFLNRVYQAYYGIIFAVILSVAAVAVGRGNVESTIDGRHNEFLIIIFPVLFILFYQFHLKYRNIFSKIIFIVFLILSLAGIADKLNLSKYFDMQKEKIAGRVCIADYYKGLNDGSCPTFPTNLANILNVAKKHNFSWYETMEK